MGGSFFDVALFYVYERTEKVLIFHYSKKSKSVWTMRMVVMISTRHHSTWIRSMKKEMKSMWMMRMMMMETKDAHIENLLVEQMYFDSV